MTKPVNGLPALCTNMLPRAMSVLPAPHSATTFALRANCQRLLTPMIARDCAGYQALAMLTQLLRHGSVSYQGGFCNLTSGHLVPLPIRERRRNC